MTNERSLQVSEDKPQVSSLWTAGGSSTDRRAVPNSPPQDPPSPTPFPVSSPCSRLPRERARGGQSSVPCPRAEGREEAAALPSPPLPSPPLLSSSPLPLSRPSLRPPRRAEARRRCGQGLPPSRPPPPPPGEEAAGAPPSSPRGGAERPRPWGWAPPGCSAAAACCPSSSPQPQVTPAAGSEGRRVGKVWGVWLGWAASGGGSPPAAPGQSLPRRWGPAGGGRSPFAAAGRSPGALSAGCQWLAVVPRRSIAWCKYLKQTTTTTTKM